MLERRGEGPSMTWTLALALRQEAWACRMHPRPHTHTHTHTHTTTHPRDIDGRPPPPYDEYRESQSHFARMTLDTSCERQEGESGTHEGGGDPHAAMYVKDVSDGHRAARVCDPHGSMAAMHDLLRSMGHNDRPLVHSTAPRDKGPGVAGDSGAGMPF